MKLRAVHSAGRFFRKLRAADAALREAALDAAADALRGELERGSASEITVVAQGARRSVGSASPDAAAREFGTLTQTPSPWLAPVLPLALEPMRAAADAAAARAVFTFGKRKK